MHSPTAVRHKFLPTLGTVKFSLLILAFGVETFPMDIFPPD
jgi:hypothetical protein